MEKLQRDISELQAQLYEDGQRSLRLQMELDAKESEIEQLQHKVSLHTSDTASVSSGADMEGEDGFMGTEGVGTIADGG